VVSAVRARCEAVVGEERPAFALEHGGGAVNDIIDKYFTGLLNPAHSNRDFGPGWLIQRKAMGYAAQRVQDCLEKESLLLCESPIEQLFFAALDVEITLGGHRHDALIVGSPKNHTPGLRPLFIQPQVTVCDARVDFLITTSSPNGFSSLVVECDGHDFHERTVEQANRDRSRDRKFQSAGYTVFRFTGSEINRDPCLKAFEVALWAENALRGS
jgi:very-short-patch-repair endonuclease